MRYEEIPIHVEGSLDYVRLETYILDTPIEKIMTKKRPMILICPGGAYEKLSYREGEPLAIHFMNQGYHACVLRYSVAPARHPIPLLEIASAMKLIREHAEEWKVDSDKIILVGSSAGGHLAGTFGVFWKRKELSDALGTTSEMLQPAGMILSYPVISSEEDVAHKGSFENLLGENYESLKDTMSLEKQVTEDTVPCFIWHTLTDEAVPVVNSFLMASALKKAGVSVELHIFPEGEHGLSLASTLVERADGTGIQKACQAWISLADTWIEQLIRK